MTQRHGSGEDRQAQNAVDDRWHRREVLDIDFHDSLEAAVRTSELLEVDRGEYADGQCDECGETDHPQRARDGGLHTGLTRIAK